MTIVDLPEEEGYAHVEVDGQLVALIWMEPYATEVLIKDGRWMVKTVGNDFLCADAIRRK